MFRLRFLLRCLLACVLALLGLLGVSVLPLRPGTPPRIAAAAVRSAEITSTASIDLSLDNGTFFDALASGLPGVQYGSASWGDCNNDGAAARCRLTRAAKPSVSCNWKRWPAELPW